MSKATVSATVSPLQILVNSSAIKQAENQYRLARIFTPYGFEPERVDYDRVSAFVNDIAQAFPQPTDSMRNVLDRIESGLAESSAILNAFAGQDVLPTLTADQLFMTARANVSTPSNVRAA
jgi:hypothetical protein